MGDVKPTHVLAGRGLPRRKGGGGRWEVFVDGAWIKEEEAMAQGIEMKAPPQPGAPSGPVMRRQGATAEQREAWDLVVGQGMYQADVGRRMGISQQAVISRLTGYMRAEGITGEVPGRMPAEEIARRRAERQARPEAPVARPEAQPDEPTPDVLEARARAARLLGSTISAPGAPSSGADQGEETAPAAAEPAPDPSSSGSSGAGDAVRSAVRTCEECGCTDGRACDGGCRWVEDPSGRMRDVCSGCATAERSHATEMLQDLDAEIERVEADLADIDQVAGVIERRRTALRAVLANLAPTRDAYADLVETERVVV